MTTINFDKRVQIEQLRYIEKKKPFHCSTAELSDSITQGAHFENRLWQRTRCIIDRFELTSILGRAARISQYTRITVYLIAILLGTTGVSLAINGLQTINIYWLLLVLLGFNVISILLWLTGIGLNITGLTRGVLARVASWLPLHQSKRQQPASRAADIAWLKCHYSGTVGKWQLSKVSHLLWLFYLVAGFSLLILLLMVQQYDFIWGTTLLPDTAFIRLTEILSIPLDTLGFKTPTTEVIYDTRIGSGEILTAEHRYQWAQLLLGAVLCFGILPRLLLLIISMLMCKRAQRLFTLDNYLPYYINLRQQLIPLASHGQIVDADENPPVISTTQIQKPNHHSLPDETYWVAVELGNDFDWTPESVSTEKNLGQVVDRHSLSLVMDYLQQQPVPVIAVAVAAARAPDRGVQRSINQLLSASTQRWLVLLQGSGEETITENRLTAWYRLAEACEIPADHVISMRMTHV